MTRIELMQDLWQAREKAAAEQRAGETQINFHIRVGLGSCGIAAGAADTMQAIHDFIAGQNLSAIRVTPTGCIGLCASGAHCPGTGARPKCRHLWQSPPAHGSADHAGAYPERHDRA